jgi:hypothetical protein
MALDARALGLLAKDQAGGAISARRMLLWLIVLLAPFQIAHAAQVVAGRLWIGPSQSGSIWLNWYSAPPGSPAISQSPVDWDGVVPEALERSCAAGLGIQLPGPHMPPRARPAARLCPFSFRTCARGGRHGPDGVGRSWRSGALFRSCSLYCRSRVPAPKCAQSTSFVPPCTAPLDVVADVLGSPKMPSGSWR